MKALLAAATVALSCAVALAGDGAGSAGLDQTWGSDGYSLTKAKASFDVAEDAYLAPSFSSYHSRDVSGTYDTFGLRGGYDPGRWSLGVDGAVQPRTDGYAKSSLGGDAAYTFYLGEPDDAPPKLDAGGGLTFTRHSDEFEAAGGGGRFGRGKERASVLVVRQTDLFVFTALRADAFIVSGRASKSSYDQDLSAVDARRAPALALDGFDQAVAGFPDSSVSARFKLKTFRIKPFVSVARTTFKLGDPPARSLEGGASVSIKRVDVVASYERYRQDGFAPRNFVTLGASLDF